MSVAICFAVFSQISQIIIEIFHVTHTHTRLTALFPGLPGWASTRKVKPIWILLKQETVSGSGISWAICKSALRSREITTPAPHHSVFTGRIPFLPPNQQRQSIECTVHSANLSRKQKRIQNLVCQMQQQQLIIFLIINCLVSSGVKCLFQNWLLKNKPTRKNKSELLY